MIEIRIEGWGKASLAHLVLDFNGTLGRDGRLLAGIRPRLTRLARHLRVHVLTADTFGRAALELDGCPCRLEILAPRNQDRAKARYVRSLGAERVVAVGNGRNDRRMLRAAALGFAVLGAEGAAADSLRAADAVFIDVRDALDALLRPLRLAATLRT